MVFCGIHVRAIPHEVLINLIQNIDGLVQERHNSSALAM